MTTKLFAFGLLMMSGVCAMAATRYVVPPGGSGTPGSGFTSWDTAATNLQDAAAATTAGDLVLVTNGTYYLTNQVAVTNFTIRSYNNGAVDVSGTVINGNNYGGKPITNRCFSLSHSNGLVEGFTITNGYVNGNGGGVSISAGTLRNCLVTGNFITNGGAGAGVYATGASSLITNCDIIANVANAGSGAGAAIGTSAQLWNSRIRFNRGLTASSHGGGVYVSSSAFLCNCELVSNSVENVSSTYGGGVLIGSGNTVRNCLIVGNSANHGGGVGCNGGGGVVESCTIYGNTGYAGNGIDTTYSAQTVHIRNTICRQAVQSYTDGATFYITNSCLLTTNLSTISAGKAYGAGNISAEPAFVWRAGGNYRLAPWSPGVDAGFWQSWMTNATDLVGNPRLSANSLPDMGAYETMAGPTSIHYVAGNGQTPVSPYTNGWAAAASNIQDVADVMSDGAMIWVTNGVYALTNQITLGYATLRSYNKGAVDRAGTIIDGNNYPGKSVTNRCFTMSYADAVIEGFTITNGYIIGDGGGVYMTAGTLRNCLVARNTCTNSAGGGGGGVYATGSSSLITSCVVRLNQGLGSTSLGAGVCAGSGATLCNSEIVSNVLRQVSTTRGAGVYIADGSTSVRNCLIVGNTGGYYGGGVGSAGNMVIESCTISGNSGYVGSGIGTGGGTPAVHIRNTICRDVVGAYSDVAYFYLTNSCLVSTNWTTKASGSGNITNDPQFASAAAGNYRLKYGSPCINTGMLLPWMTPGTVDLDGNPRISPSINGTVDMGAYEFPIQSGSTFTVR